MKLITIIFLLLSVNTYAQFKVEITPSDSKLAKMQIEAQTLNKAIKKLKKVVKRSSWLKHEIKDTESGYIFSETETDLEGNEVIKYYHPVNFSVNLVDITQELADKETQRLERKNEIAQIKNMKDNINNSDLPAWHKKLLKRLIKELRD